MRVWPFAPATAVVVVLLLAGCGKGGASGGVRGVASPSGAGHPTAVDISTGMQVALEKATSFQITGDWGTGSRRRVIDVTSNRAGNVAGTITVSHEQIVVAANKRRAYIKLTAGFLTWDHLPSSACTTYCGKYITGPAGPFRKEFGDWRMPIVLGPYTANVLSAHFAGPTTVDGQAAWMLHDSGDKSAGYPAYTLYVAAHGTPYLLRLREGLMDLRFTQWNSAVVPPAPGAGKVVKISQVANG